MKITFLIGALDSGGAQRVICSLAGSLAEKNEATILTLTDSPSHYPVPAHVRRAVLESRGKRKWIRNVKRILNFIRYMRNSGSDGYVVFLPQLVMLSLLLKPIAKAPVIVSIRVDPHIEYRSWWMKVLAWILFRRADGMVFQTEDARRFFDFIPIRSWAVIPNAVQAPPAERPERREKRLISVGRLEPQKNIGLMIEAFSDICGSFPEYSMIIFGEGGERGRLEGMARDKGLDGRIRFPGTTKDVWAELRKSEIFIMTSEFEGISNALLEAMSAGLPVIATDCMGGGARLLIKDGENGFLVPRGDSDGVKRAMRRLMQDEELRRRMGKNAASVNQLYSPSEIYGKWEAYIERIVTGPAG